MSITRTGVRCRHVRVPVCRRGFNPRACARARARTRTVRWGGYVLNKDVGLVGEGWRLGVGIPYCESCRRGCGKGRSNSSG
jgi:hypothetical protein